MAVLHGPANAELQRVLRECAETPFEESDWLLGSGSSRWRGGDITIHTDFGPVAQDKETNQDFVVGWTADGSRAQPVVPWALAMADGVTASFYAELGAELACRASLARLLMHPGKGKAKALDAVNAAGDAVGVVGDAIAANPELYKPDDMFKSTWKYILREGLLLQTTLTLAWMERGTCYLAMVGDGGAAVELRRRSGHKQVVLAAPVVETSLVHAIGPRNRHVDGFDVWQQVGAENLCQLAVYTDGVGHGIRSNTSLLFDPLRKMGGDSKVSNRVRALIQEWIRTRAEEFEDNLSLAVVTWY
jgi:hypothetical protein